MKKKANLADFVNGGGQNVFVRPNQVIACSLEYSPLSDEMKHGVLDVVKNELLTPKGLRTLAPKNPAYEGTYEGDRNPGQSLPSGNGLALAARTLYRS